MDARFVTRKITDTVAKIPPSGGGNDQVLELGNLDAQRDWGYAKEYVDGMWLMLQGTARRLRGGDRRDAQASASFARWRGLVGNSSTGSGSVRIDEQYFRPTEVEELCGDATRAHEQLGWRASTRFHDLVALMLQHDLNEAGLADRLQPLQQGTTG